jgi:hypothetical protein
MEWPNRPGAAEWPDARRTSASGCQSPAFGFGRTAIAQGYETRLACPCNVFAKVFGDAKMFAKVKSGANIKETALG